MAARGLVGTDFDSCMHNWATQGLNYYILAKLLWNPNLDVDAEIETYCQSGFGEGWKEVRSYFAVGEAHEPDLRGPDQHPGPGYAGRIDHDPLYHRSACGIAGLPGCRRSAREAQDPASQQRIAFLRRGLDSTEIQAAAHSLLRRAKDLNAEERDQAVRLLDRRWAMMRKMFEEEHYAVNVAAVLQSEEARFVPLGCAGQAPMARAIIH